MRVSPHPIYKSGRVSRLVNGGPPMVTIDTAHVFAAFGGARGLIACLDIHSPGHGLTYARVYNWKKRGIPKDCVGAVIHCIQQSGRSVNEFLFDPDEMAAPTAAALPTHLP